MPSIPLASPQNVAAPQEPALPAQPGPPTEIRVRDVQGERIIRIPRAESPTSLYQAARAKREVLGQQRDELQEQRDDLARELRDNAAVGGADRAGMERRITEYDARLSEMEKQITQADAEVAAAAGVAGAVPVEPPHPPNSGLPEELIAIPIVFTIFVLFPLAIAWSRRIWKRTGLVTAPIPTVVQDRLARLEQNVDTIAIEVERMSEGQRFMTKLFSDSGARAMVQGGGAAQPIEVGLRDREGER